MYIFIFNVLNVCCSTVPILTKTFLGVSVLTLGARKPIGKNLKVVRVEL